MACHWRLYAEANGIPATNNSSWKKIVALYHLNYASIDTNGAKGSWPKQLVALVDTAGSPGLTAGVVGSDTKRLVDRDVNTLRASHAKALALDGGRAPLT